jgi:hypothetical protein
MKKLISIGASFILAVSAFATGNEGVNPAQGGVLTPASGVSSITNTFAFPYQTVPLMIVYAGATNSTPITNAITTTNFTLSYPVNGSTNASFVWQAFVGGTKMCFGSSTNVAATSTSITFPFAYATPPVVVATGQGGTNSQNVVSVTAVTTTNFSLLANASQTNYWQAIGTVYSPQSEYQGNFPVNNKVLTP